CFGLRHGTGPLELAGPGVRRCVETAVPEKVEIAIDVDTPAIIAGATPLPPVERAISPPLHSDLFLPIRAVRIDQRKNDEVETATDGRAAAPRVGLRAKRNAAAPGEG